MDKKRAYIVDDDPALRRTIKRLLGGAGIDGEEFESAERLLDGYSERPVGCVLLDVRLPGMDGLELLGRISDLQPPNPVVMLSGFADVPSAVRAVQMGAIDFLQKPFNKDQLLEVVLRAFDTVALITSRAREFDTLTPRERDVLLALSDGASNKVVAHRLDLSPRTVEMHRARVFKKLGVSNLTQAQMRARHAGLID